MWDASPSVWLELRIWGSPWIPQAKFPWSEHKSPGKWKPLVFWSRASFRATQFLVLRQWKGWGMWELLAKWGRLCAVLMWWKMSLDPATSQETPQWQHLAQKFWLNLVVWGGDGGLLRWTRPLNCLFPGKPFQEHHGLILLPEMWGPKCENNPFQCPHCSHRLELEKEKHQAPNTGTHSLVRKYLQGSRFTGSKMRGILSISFPPDCGECNIFLPLLCQSKQKISDQKELDTNGVWHIFFKEQGEELLLNTNPAVPLGNKK